MVVVVGDVILCCLMRGIVYVNIFLNSLKTFYVIFIINKKVIKIKRKHINYITCKICNKKMDTGMCYTMLERWIRTKIVKRKHWHTKAEVVFKQETGLYFSTIEKEWEK